MKFANIFTIITILLCIGITTPMMAQTGGRKKEHRNQRGGGSIFKRKKSGGHADAFAKGGQKKGFFARLFKGKKSKGGWVYHKTNPGIKQNREQSKLFSRFRTKNKRFRDGVLANQNRKRAGSRGGNFSKKKR